jgi:hypothetical protein
MQYRQASRGRGVEGASEEEREGMEEKEGESAGFR